MIRNKFVMSVGGLESRCNAPVTLAVAAALDHHYTYHCSLQLQSVAYLEGA